MLQSVAHEAGIRNGYSGWNGRAWPADADPIPTPSCCSRQPLAAIRRRTSPAKRRRRSGGDRAGRCRLDSSLRRGSARSRPKQIVSRGRDPSWPFWDRPNRGVREQSGSLRRRQDNLSGKPEGPDRTVRAKLAMGPLPARRLPACHHRSQKAGSRGRVSGVLLRVQCHQSKGSSADVLSAYQSPNLRSTSAG
jgi:hypothetical protein